MAEIASAFVSLLPSAKGFGKKTEQQIGGEMKSSGSRTGKVFGGAMAVAAGAAVAGAAAVGVFAKGAIDEAREAQKVGALTASTIKATGGAAKVTAKQVGDLAGAISRKTGIDDETIQSGQNMLLTFKNIRNETGKGNDIFSQTSKTLVDLSAAMGTEPEQAAIQLGKALNDPIKGVGALSRVGVTFTEGQKAQIKTLVESGNVMGAQKIILKELNSEFGGAAEAQATAGDKFKVAFGNLQESVGTALLPALDKALGALTSLTNFAADNVGPAISGIATFIKPAVDGFKALFASFSGGGQASVLGGIITSIGNTFRTVLLPAVLAVGQYLRANLFPIFQQVATIIATRVVPIVVSLAQFFIGTVYPAIVKIAVAVGKNLKPVLDALFAVIRNRVLPAVNMFLAKLQEWMPTIKKVIAVVLVIIGTVLKFASAILGKVLPPLIRFAGFFLGTLFGAIVKVIGILVKIIGTVISVGSAFVKAITFVARFQAGVVAQVGKALAFVRGIPGKILSGLGSLASLLYGAGMDLIRGLINGIRAMAGNVASEARAVVSNAISAARDALGIRSPSRVFHQIGVYVGQGFELGIASRGKSVRKVIEKLAASAKNALKNIRAQAKDFASSVAGTFKGDLFGNGAGGLLLQLQADTNDANAMRQALRRAASRGLNGGLYKELAASGDLNTAQQIASKSALEIAALERAYAARNKATAGLGDAASREAYGARIRELNDRLGDLNRALRFLPKDVERGARAGVGDRDRNATTRRRAGK